MSLNYPCLIRKNTPKLRKKLEELGLELINNDNCTLDAHNYDGKGNHKTINEGTAIITYLTNHYGVIYDITDTALKNRIDCGENEDMFLAIAALRNDTDKNQWFVLDSYYGSINYPYQFFYPEGIFVLCSSDKWEDNIFSVTKAHKANVREIIEHFKNKLY